MCKLIYVGSCTFSTSCQSSQLTGLELQSLLLPTLVTDLIAAITKCGFKSAPSPTVWVLASVSPFCIPTSYWLFCLCMFCDLLPVATHSLVPFNIYLQLITQLCVLVVTRSFCAVFDQLF